MSTKIDLVTWDSKSTRINRSHERSYYSNPYHLEFTLGTVKQCLEMTPDTTKASPDCFGVRQLPDSPWFTQIASELLECLSVVHHARGDGFLRKRI